MLHRPAMPARQIVPADWPGRLAQQVVLAGRVGSRRKRRLMATLCSRRRRQLPVSRQDRKLKGRPRTARDPRIMISLVSSLKMATAGPIALSSESGELGLPTGLTNVGYPDALVFSQFEQMACSTRRDVWGRALRHRSGSGGVRDPKVDGRR